MDAVIVDRLWRGDVNLSLIDELINKIRLSGAKLIYALDDNFLDLPAQDGEAPDEGRIAIVRELLSQADYVWVTTQPLKERFEQFNRNIIILPHALDERLLVPRLTGKNDSLFEQKRLVIGFMGTFTHDDDLLMVLPALQEISQRYPNRIEIQINGAIRRKETLN
jgi:glycosyltransferase involved in cell wall biosynthesis